jgi:hypothetical protein
VSRPEADVRRGVMSQRDQERVIVSEAIVNAWRDDGYRERLITDVAGVLRDAGLQLPDECRVLVVENTDAIWHLTVPRREDPAGGELEQFVAELAAQLPLPPGVEMHLHQDTVDERYVVLPLPPHEMDALSEQELKSVVGGLVFGPLSGGGNGGDGGAGVLFGNGGNGGAGTTGVVPGVFGDGGNGGNGGVGGF